jgi:hypothetical protein
MQSAIHACCLGARWATNKHALVCFIKHMMGAPLTHGIQVLLHTTNLLFVVGYKLSMGYPGLPKVGVFPYDSDRIIVGGSPTATSLSCVIQPGYISWRVGQ